MEQESEEYVAGEVELDESYFGARRKGKRGRSAAGKVIVFGMLKRGGKVYTRVIEDIKTKALMPIIKRKVVLDSVVYTDCYRSYNALDVSGFHHHRIKHSSHFAEEQSKHINSIENFWIKPKGSYESTIVFHKKSLPVVPKRMRVSIQLRST